MSAYLERERRYDESARKGYQSIMEIAKKSPYQSQGNGRQYVDFTVGTDKSVVSKVRVLVDFRGEYFSSFIIESKMLPIKVTAPIRNRINFSAQEAYDYIMLKVKELNS